MNHTVLSQLHKLTKKELVRLVIGLTNVNEELSRQLEEFSREVTCPQCGWEVTSNRNDCAKGC